MNNEDQQKLQNILDAEAGLLSCFILNESAVNSVITDFSSSDFLEEKNQKVFNSINKLFTDGSPIDIVSISQQVKTKNLKEYVADLVSFVSTGTNFEYYAKLVKDNSTRRRLAELGSNIILQTSKDVELDQIFKELDSSLSNITSTTKGVGEVDTVKQVDEVIVNVKRLKDNPQEVVGLSTGFPKIDIKLAGLHKTDLLILAARPARGKSAFALQLARNVAFKSNTTTLFFSLEMGAEQLIQRLVASEAKVELSKIRSGKVSEKELEALSLGGEIIKNIPLYFNDKAGIQVKDIRSQIKSLNAKLDNKVGFVVVDYLQLMAIGKNTSSMVQEVTEISRGLKVIAKEFNIPVLALSQLSRNVESRGGRPRLSDLRDSGSIEQDADVVMFLHSENIEEDGFGQKEVELLIEKHRNGSTGSVSLKFDGAKMTFLEVDESLDPKNW